MIYAWRYPKRIHRSVMIGVNPPGNFLWDAKTTGEQIRRYAALCAKDAACHARTPDLAASLHSAFRTIPDRFWFLPVKRGNVQAAAFFGLNNATADGAGPIPAAKTIDTLLSAGKGDGSGAWFLSLMAQVAFPNAQVWGEAAATGRHGCGRRATLLRRACGPRLGHRRPLTDLVWLDGQLLTRGRRTRTRTSTRASATRTSRRC